MPEKDAGWKIMPAENNAIIPMLPCNGRIRSTHHFEIDELIKTAIEIHIDLLVFLL